MATVNIWDAIQSLQAELSAPGPSIAQAGQPYDYLLVFGEGERNAAAESHSMLGDLVATIVRGAFTEKGAADSARDLAKQLAEGRRAVIQRSPVETLGVV